MLLFWGILGAAATDPADLTVEVSGLCKQSDVSTRDYCFTGACLTADAPDDIPARGTRVALRFNTVIRNEGELATTMADADSDSFFDSTCLDCGKKPFKMVKQFKSHSIVAVDSDAIAPGTSALVLPHCLQDTDCDEGEKTFTECGTPGLSPGCADSRSYEDFCQWIDVTALGSGPFRLRVEINYSPGISGIEENTYLNNVAYVEFVLVDLPTCDGVSQCTSIIAVFLPLILVCCCCSCCCWFCYYRGKKQGKKSATPAIQQSTPPAQQSTPPPADVERAPLITKGARRRVLNFDL